MYAPAGTDPQRRPDRFLLGRESVYAPACARPRLKPEPAFEMIHFWCTILGEPPANLTAEYRGRVLDARGCTVGLNGCQRTFEVHAALADEGVEFQLLEARGVNGSQRLMCLRTSRDLGAILQLLRACHDEAAARGGAALPPDAALPPLPQAPGPAHAHVY